MKLPACQAPSAERILAVFADLTRHELHRNGRLVQTFEAELTPLRQQFLELLGVPSTASLPTTAFTRAGGKGSIRLH